jgi:hypothetical protein
MKRNEPASSVHRVRLAASLDRHAVEALTLELRRLAAEQGVDIRVTLAPAREERSA